MRVIYAPQIVKKVFCRLSKIPLKLSSGRPLYILYTVFLLKRRRGMERLTYLIRFQIKCLSSNISNSFRIFSSSFNWCFSSSEYFTKFLAIKARILFNKINQLNWGFFFITVQIIVSWKLISWKILCSFRKWISKNIESFYSTFLKSNVYVSNFWEPN